MSVDSLAVGSELTSSDIEYLIDQVFEPKSADSHKMCAYTVVTMDGNAVERQERYDPYFGAEQAWSLVSINGDTPTVEQLDKYEPVEEARHPAVLSFDFIDTETLKFEELDKGALRFSFELRHDLKFENNHLLSNTIFIDPILAQVKEIRRTSTEPFRLAKFARVFEFEAIDEFDYEEETQTVVLVASSIRFKARTGELTIDQSVKRTFGAFDCSTVPIAVPEEEPEVPQGNEFEPLFDSAPIFPAP